MAGRSNFKRVLVGLHQHSARHGLQLAINVAVLLRLDLCGFFVKEESLGRLAALPFAREFRPLGGGWRPIDLDGLSREVEVAANTAQRLFDNSVKGLGLTCQFEVVSGSLPEKLALFSRDGDIVIVCEPTGSSKLSMPSSLSLVEAAFRSAAAVMLVPPGVQWRPGPIVAVVTRPDDATIEIAAGIARSAGEEMVIVEAFRSSPETPTLAERLEARPHSKQLRACPTLLDPSGICASLCELRERLVVIEQGAVDRSIPALLASSRHVPVLIADGASSA